ncbi:hypothetical protein NLG97_g6153 [Lecanicillium saksenae]|uniref:Uncharacterized protein n=1 Tax=Lecanicillium saksenae TaxID=468837 RepID=A0ACC1QRT3_9HYPO|nr:hypothetical protein NLG97_g6153 [Lecanicillium saksenae]
MFAGVGVEIYGVRSHRSGGPSVTVGSPYRQLENVLIERDALRKQCGAGKFGTSALRTLQPALGTSARRTRQPALTT